MRNPAFGFSFKVFLLLCDFVVLIVIFPLVQSLRVGTHFSVLTVSPGYWFVIVIAILSLYIAGSYDFRMQRLRDAILPSTFVVVGIVVVVVVFVNYLLAKERAGLFGRGVLVGGSVLFGFWLWGSRSLVRWRQSRLAAKMRYRFCVEDACRRELVKDLAALHLDGEFHSIESLSQTEPSSLDRLYVQEKLLSRHPREAEGLAIARLHGRAIAGLSDFYESYLGKLPVSSLSPEWFILANGFGVSGRPLVLRLKRLTDLLFAVVLLVITAPIVCLSALIVRLESKGSFLYSQTRMGRFGEPFTIYKIRTMRSDAERDGARWAERNDARITRVGNFLRKTRIDELPQLWNILRGDMSFVGPRPERPEFIAELSKQIPYYDLRHVVLPGVTGWAQVMYPYGASIDDARHKLEFDLYYIRHAGFLTDLRILFRTVRIVLMAEGR